jgi:hypothetical protein
VAIQHVEDGRLIVEFVRAYQPHLRSLAAILGPPPARPQEPLEIDDAVARGIAEGWRESLAGPDR